MTGYSKELFLQDLENYKNTIKLNDLRTGNIIGNRIMSNAHLFDEKYYGIIGFFLKQIVAEALVLRNLNDSETTSVISDKTIDFVQNIIEPQINSNITDYDKIWIGYNNVMMKTRQIFIPKGEKEVYKLNQAFTTESFQNLSKMLFSGKENLVYLTNNFLKGILNEMNRIAKTYGTNTDDLYFLSLLIMIDRLDEYVGLTIIDANDFEKRIRNEIIPQINKLEKFLTDQNKKEKVNDLLWELIREWRFDFIKFLDVRRTNPTNPTPVQVQEDIKPAVKSKLVEELAKSLEDEVSGR